MKNPTIKEKPWGIICIAIILLSCNPVGGFFPTPTATPTATQTATPTASPTPTTTPTNTPISAGLWGSKDSTAAIQKRLGKGAESSLAVSPDGKTVAVTGNLNASTFRFDTLEEIWTSPLEQMTPQPEGSMGRGAAAWSPDGSQLATLSDFGVMVWDPATGRKLHAFPVDRLIASSLGWSADGRWVTAGLYDGVVYLTDAESGGQIFRLDPEEVVSTFDWLPQEGILAVGLGDGTIDFWDTASGAQTLSLLPFCAAYCVQKLKWSPDGTRLASVSSGGEGEVAVWDPRTGTKLFSVSKPYGEQASVMAWSPDNYYLAAAFTNREIIVWNGKTGSRIQSLSRKGSGGSDAILSLGWSPDGRYLLSLSRYAPVTVWDIGTGGEVRSLDEHGTWVMSLGWSPDGQLLAAGYEDGGVIVWKSPGGEKLWSARDPNGWVGDLAWSPDGEKIATAGTDSIVFWEARSGRQLDVWRFSTMSLGVAWSPDGGRLATTTYEGSGVIWDVSTGGKLVELPEESAKGCLSWSPQGDLLGTCYFDYERDQPQIALWDPVSGELVRSVSGLYGLVWSPFGNVVASVSDSGTRALSDDKILVLWDVGTGEEIRRFELNYFPNYFSFSPDGNYLVVSGDKRHSIFVLDARTGESLHTLRGHVEFVTNVAWSPLGDLIASASWDGTVILWRADPG